MSNVPTAPSLTTAVPTRTAPHSARQRLRAVRPDEAPPAPDFLPPGATWLPAPGHVLPAVPGGAPMVGYLVLVPAETALPAPAPAVDQVPAPAPAPVTVPAPAVSAAPGGPALRIDPERRTAEVDGRQLDLTYLEFELLAHLVAHPHRVHSRDQLVTTVWGYGHVGDGRTVDVHVARLRRKLGGAHRGSIVTVRRVGYKYTPVQA